MRPVIAIDGPAGSGKGTMARKLASHFGFEYLDTGILYRTIAYVLNQKINKINISALSIEQVLDISKKIGDAILRSSENSMQASKIAKELEMREKITTLSQDFVDYIEKKGNIAVLDGRDIGTVVVPDAFCKIFITADLKIRAKRRFQCLKLKDPNVKFLNILKEISLRDQQDQTRKIAPLLCNKSYSILDSSHDNIKESFDKLLSIVNKRLLLIR